MIFFYNEKKIKLVGKGKGKKKGKKGRKALRKGKRNGKKGNRSRKKGNRNGKKGISGKKGKKSRGKKEGRKGRRTFKLRERSLPTCFSKIFKYASKLKKSRNIVSQANRINGTKTQMKGKQEKKVSTYHI